MTENKSISLLKFIKDEDWQINEDYLNSCQPHEPIMEMFISLILDSTHHQKIILSPIVLNKNKEIIQGHNLIIGAIFVMKLFSPFNKNWKDFKHVSSKVNIDEIKNIVFNDNIPDATKNALAGQIKNSQTELNIFINNFKIDNLEKIAEERLFCPIVEVNEDCSAISMSNTMSALTPEKPIWKIFIDSIIDHVDLNIYKKNKQNIYDLVSNNIIKRFFRITPGSTSFNQLDFLSHHAIIADDLMLLKVQMIQNNYSLWRNVFNIRVKGWIRSNFGPSFKSLKEFENAILKISKRFMFLTEINNQMKNTEISAFTKIMIMKLFQSKIPAEFLLSICEKHISYENDNFKIAKNIELDNFLSGIHKINLRSLFLPIQQSPQDREKLFFEVISSKHEITDLNEFISTVEEILIRSLKPIDQKSKLDNDHLKNIVEKTLRAKRIDQLASPINPNHALVSALGEMINFMELTKYDHAIEDFALPAPLYISKMIAPNQESTNQQLFLGDILFVPSNLANQAMAQLKNRQMPDWQQLYFEACKKFRYLMEDKIFMEVISTKKFSEDDLKERTLFYKDLIEKSLEI